VKPSTLFATYATTIEQQMSESYLLQPTGQEAKHITPQLGDNDQNLGDQSRFVSQSTSTRDSETLSSDNFATFPYSGTHSIAIPTTSILRVPPISTPLLSLIEKGSKSITETVKLAGLSLSDTATPIPSETNENSGFESTSSDVRRKFSGTSEQVSSQTTPDIAEAPTTDLFDQPSLPSTETQSIHIGTPSETLGAVVNTPGYETNPEAVGSLTSSAQLVSSTGKPNLGFSEADSSLVSETRNPSNESRESGAEPEKSFTEVSQASGSSQVTSVSMILTAGSGHADNTFRHPHIKFIDELHHSSLTILPFTETNQNSALNIKPLVEVALSKNTSEDLSYLMIDNIVSTRSSSGFPDGLHTEITQIDTANSLTPTRSAHGDHIAQPTDESSSEVIDPVNSLNASHPVKKESIIISVGVVSTAACLSVFIFVWVRRRRKGRIILRHGLPKPRNPKHLDPTRSHFSLDSTISS
jgi:hypothetical protein